MKNIRFTLPVILILTFLSCKEKAEQAAPAPLQIKVINVEKKSLPIFHSYVGQTYGLEDVSINARVEGFLEQIHFIEGSRVKKGDLLYSIDPAPLQAEVANQRSKVAEAETKLANAENELARYRPLAEINAVSKSDLDHAQAQRDASEASLKAAKSQLRIAQINLGYTRVISPISGFIGKTQARVGELVGRTPNPVILNTVSKIDHIRVHFFLTESEYLTLARYVFNNKGKRKSENEDGVMTLILSDGSEHPYPGTVDFINREVDSSTGAILVQATFPNPDLILRPGQFARVKILLQNTQGSIVIPQRCASELQGQYSVFVVNNENKIEARQIEVEDKIGDMMIIRSGLSAGEKIVLEALQKVRTGMEVVPVDGEFESKILTD